MKKLFLLIAIIAIIGVNASVMFSEDKTADVTLDKLKHKSMAFIEEDEGDWETNDTYQAQMSNGCWETCYDCASSSWEDECTNGMYCTAYC